MSKKIINDPFVDRETQKYENPIPSREYIMDYLREQGKPMRRDDLIDALHLETEEEQEGLRRRLRAMERDGQLVFTRRGGYGLTEKMDLVKGRIQGHRDGFGFVIPDDGSNDLFLNARQMEKLFHGDRVLAHVVSVDRRGRREGAVVEVLERSLKSVVGRLYSERGITYVIPDEKRINHHILIAPDDRANAENGQIVIAEILTSPSHRNQATGRIIEVLGDHMAPGMEVEIAIRNYNLPHIWPQDVLDEIADLHEEVKEKDKKSRVDLRKLSFVTIDGEDAKDFDDAVYCEKRKGGGWTLYVAIADVSHYVQPNSALDIEAQERGNSVYFPGEVVPMLPEILSNGLCSLKPKVDRLCLVCEIAISKTGKASSYKFYSAVMHSQARLTYTYVANVLANPKTITKDQQFLLPHLQSLNDLFEKLHANRQARGAIDFETTETKVIFGEHRKIEKIVPTERNVAHRIIEECMLLANVSAAEFLLSKEIPALYRIHEGPTFDKLQDLRSFLAEVGLRLPGKSKLPQPSDYAKLLQTIRGRSDSHLIQTVLLRSLSQAVYSPDNIGHFGLAYDSYTHFTSPIRRYPDLLVHRAIKHLLAKKKIKSFPYDHAIMEQMGMQCSMTERRADEATRNALDWLKCEFIKDRLGEEFDGIVTSVTAFGLFVELADIYVEGLLHVTALKNDYYHFDPLHRRLRGDRTGTVYHLGDKIKVRVARVDLDERQIDFELVESKNNKTNQKTKKKEKIKKKRG